MIPRVASGPVRECASAPLPGHLNCENDHMYCVTKYLNAIRLLVYVIYGGIPTNGKMSSHSYYTTHTADSDSTNSQREPAANRLNITGRQNIRATKTTSTSTSISNNSNGDDGNDEPSRRSLQLKSRCARDDEIATKEDEIATKDDEKLGLSFIQMAKDLPGINRTTNTRTEDKDEHQSYETQYDDSLDTHIFFELPDGSPAHSNKFTGEIFYDIIDNHPKRKMNSTQHRLNSPNEKQIPSIIITPICEKDEVQIADTASETDINISQVERTKLRTRRRAFSESQVFLTPLSSKNAKSYIKCIC